MKNNRQEINNELKKLGLRRVKNPISFDTTTIDKRGTDYGQLGIGTVSQVKNQLDMGEANYEDTESDSKKSEWKVYRKAQKALDKAPKNNYAISPRHTADHFGYANLDDISNIADGKQPTAKSVKKNYINKLTEYQERLNNFEHQADNLNKRIDNKQINNQQLGDEVYSLDYSEAMNAQNDTVQRAIDKHGIMGLDEVHDAVEENPNIDNPMTQDDIDLEIKHVKSNPKYQSVQMVKNPTGKHDLKPLSSQLVKKIATNARNQALKNSKYLGKRMKQIAPKQQANLKRKLAIKTEINKLGLHNSYNSIEGVDDPLELHDSRGHRYGDLGVNKASEVMNTLADSQNYEDNTNVYWTDKDDELTDKALTKLSKVPKNNYVISPYMDMRFNPSIKDIKKIIQGKKPTIQGVKKNYIHKLHDKQQGLHKFEHYAQHVMKQTQYKGLNHAQLSSIMGKTRSSEINNVHTYNVLNLEKKNRIAPLDDINDQVQSKYLVGDTDIDELPKKQRNVLTEIDKKLDDPRYTFDVQQTKPHLTGKNDFKPLSHKVVNKIATKANSIAIKNSKYFAKKLNRVTPSVNKQTSLLKKLHINKPSINNKKHIKSQHKSINVKKQNRKLKRNKTHNRNIERGPQI